MKIIRILDEFRVIVDYGYNDNAKIGDKLMVKSQKEIEIFDISTGIILGKIQLHKQKLQVFEIYPEFCICINGESLIDTPLRRLNVDITAIEPPLDMRIQLCDLVEKIK